jgi:uncharacterized protein YaeQ
LSLYKRDCRKGKGYAACLPKKIGVTGLFWYSSGPARLRLIPHTRIRTMALKATIFKANLQIANMDRHYYREHALTIARHPSETDERMMVRLLAFACQASETLAFSKGLSDVDEPDLWQKDLTGAIELWIEIGQPDEKRMLKACGRAAQVVVYCYGNTSSIWWAQVKGKVERAKNLTVLALPAPTAQALAQLAQRSMQLQCSIEDGQIWLRSNEAAVEVSLTPLQTAVAWPA